MASASSGVYFPALDECLKGEQPLVSWKDASSILSDWPSAESSRGLERFLQDETTTSLLAHPTDGYASPSAQSKADFETKTAAINILPASDGEYDINQLKTDTLWLAKEVNIDELAALRVTILEWQQRPALRLDGSWSEEEILSVRQATASNAITSLLARKIHKNATEDYNKLKNAFDDEEQRQQRLVRTFYTEQASMLRTSRILHNLGQDEELQAPDLVQTKQSSGDKQRSRSWILLYAKSLAHRQDPRREQHKGSDDFLDGVNALRRRLDRLGDPSARPGSVQDDDLLSQFFTEATLDEIVSILQLMLVCVRAKPGLPTAHWVNAWYSLMDDAAFFSDFSVDSAEASDLTTIIQCLISVLSTSLLQAPQALDYLHAKYASPDNPNYPNLDDPNYLEDDECLRILTSSLLGATAQSIRHASPVVFAWSIISQRIRDVASAGHSEPSRFIREASVDSEYPSSRRSSIRDPSAIQTRPEALLGIILDSLPGEDAITVMASGAVNQMSVFDTIGLISDHMVGTFGSLVDMHMAIVSKVVFIELLREGLPLVQYGPELIASIGRLLTYEDAQLTDPSHQAMWPLQPAKIMFDDEQMGPLFMEQVITRYPHELSPFLLVISALSRSVASLDDEGSRLVLLLENMSRFTRVMPSGFEAYDLVSEDVASNQIQLTTSLPMLDAITLRDTRPARPAANDNGSTGGFYIPAGTLGLVVSDNRPFRVRWDYQHSALEHLGRLLSTRSKSGTGVFHQPAESIDLDEAADILLLITSMHEGIVAFGDLEAATQFLGRLSYGLDRNEDIIRLVFDLLESELQSITDQARTEAPLNLLMYVTRFMCSLLKVRPERVWSYLSRSRLLAQDTDSSGLVAVVEVAEAPSAQYPFLRSCVSLYRCLVEDVVERAVSQRTVSKAVTRFDAQASQNGSTPDKVKTSSLASLTRLLVDAYQSQSMWRFANEFERHALKAGILSAFAKVLDYAYGTGEKGSTTSVSFSKVLEPSAQLIMNAFLKTTADESSIRSMLDSFVFAIPGHSTSTSQPLTKARNEDALAALDLCSMVLRSARYLDRPTKSMTTQLLQAIPVLVRLHRVSTRVKEAWADLLTVLVQSANENSEEPRSLLGHLSPESATSFLAVIRRMGEPLQSTETEVKVWDLLSSVVSNKQQWLAICLLTGSTPKDRLKSKSSAEGSRPTSLLSLALNDLSKIGELPLRRATAMLLFVSLAQDHWPWTTFEIARHSDFLNALTDWLAELKMNSKTSDTEIATRAAMENTMAACISNILAQYLHNSPQFGATSLANSITPKLRYLRDNAVTVDGYNHSLHKNLARNFSLKFPQTTLLDFKRTTLRPYDYGRSYYYDLELANKSLSFEPAWTRNNNQGLAAEVARANANLSFVESQISLLKSYRGLAMQLGVAVGDEPQVQSDLATTAGLCLKANMEVTIPLAVFENVSQLRAEFAFALMQKLVSIRSKQAEVRDLVFVAWDTIRTCGQDLEVTDTARDTEYYRTLQRILFLSLQPQIYNPSSASGFGKSSKDKPQPRNGLAIENLLLEMLQKVVITNYRALCRSAHEDAQSVEPADFAILTAIIQTILRIPGVEALHPQIAATFGDASIVRYATSLYSWSDRLADPATLDPIHGEHSILFLLALSTIPPLAEQMGIEGVLSSLAAANISSYLSNPSHGGKGPFDQPTRMHDIWTRGLLPLCLNLLEAVGPPIASEVAGFLNAFPAQLARAQSDLDTKQPSSVRRPHAGAITLGLASETHSLALIGSILDRLKALGPAVGVNASEIASLSYDRLAVREEVEGMLRSKRALRERIVPVGEREAEWARSKPERGSGSDADSRLEEKVVAELEAALDCLRT